MTSRRKGAMAARTGRTRYFRLASVAVLATLSAISVATIAASPSRDDDRDRDDRDAYAIGLWGDLPYSTEQETGVLRLIDDMNKQDLAFSVHDGDLKTGNGAPICDDNLYFAALDMFNSLKAAAMFTPGDNDWTDCDRPNNGGVDSLAQLSRERQILFATPFSLGKHRLRQEVQTDPICLGGSNASPNYEGCVENRRWMVGRVMYATLNIQGSCNNLCGDKYNVAEYTARNAADIAWMNETFTESTKHHAVAIMFISQADPGFSESEFDAPNRNPTTLAQTDPCDANPTKSATPCDGFQEFLLALRANVITFGKPVTYVHGDSHYFRIDKPLLDAVGHRLQNFTRLETFGDHAPDNGNNDVQWVKVLVDARTPEVFAYQPQIIPANQTAVPLP